MKREFLEGLELNGTKLSKDLIDQIMAENGKDIAAEQAKTTAKEGELTTAKNTIKELQEAAKKFEGTDPEKLKQELTDLQKKYDADLATSKLNSALEMALVQAKVRDVKAAKALLNLGEIKLDGEKLLGLDGQMEGLKKDKAWLFEEAVPKSELPKGPTVKTGAPHRDGGSEPKTFSLRDAVRESLQGTKE